MNHNIVQSLVDAVNRNSDIISLYHCIGDRMNISFRCHEAIDGLFLYSATCSAVPEVDIQQIITIAKEACKVIEFLNKTVCPVVDKLP